MKKYISLFTLILLVYQSKSQINLDDVLYASINSTPRLKQRQEESRKMLGHTLKVVRYSRIKSIDYTIDGGDANVLSEKVVYLPEQYIINYYSNKNCSDNRRGWTQNLALKVTQGQIVKVTNAVKSSKKTSYSLGFKIPIPKIGLDISGSTSSEFTFETSNSQEVQRTTTTEETVTKTIDFEVDPKRALYVKFQTTKYTLRVPFEATLMVNGYVMIQNVQRLEIVGRNSNEGVTEERIPFEALLSNEQRTFAISGFLENSKAGKEEVDYAEVSLPSDSCDKIPTANPFVTISEKIAGNKSLTKEELEILKKPNEYLLKSDLGEGKLEADETIRKLNLNFKKK